MHASSPSKEERQGDFSFLERIKGCKCERELQTVLITFLKIQEYYNYTVQL